MKKEAKKKQDSKSSKTQDTNSFGVASVVLGIISIVFSSIYGLVIGVIALVFANKQNTRAKNNWSKAGKILAIVGIILSIVGTILNILYFQEIISQAGGAYALQ